MTGDAGTYTAPALRVGDYAVSAELAGFKKEVRRGIVLQVNAVAVVDITVGRDADHAAQASTARRIMVQAGGATAVSASLPATTAAQKTPQITKCTMCTFVNEMEAVSERGEQALRERVAALSEEERQLLRETLTA